MPPVYCSEVRVQPEFVGGQNPTQVFSNVNLDPEFLRRLVYNITPGNPDTQEPLSIHEENGVYAFRRSSDPLLGVVGVVDLSAELSFEDLNRIFEKVYQVGPKLLDGNISPPVRHQIKTQATVIGLKRYTFVDGSDLDGLVAELHEAYEDIDRILTNANQNERTHTTIRDFVKTLNVYVPFAGGRVSIVDYNPFEGLLRISIDSSLTVNEDIERVWKELLMNAIKYDPEGDKRVELYEKDGRIHFSLSDMGIGVSRDEIFRIFEDGYRTDTAKGVSEGTGWGLSDVVKNLVEGEELIFVSKDEQGSFGVRVTKTDGRVDIEEIGFNLEHSNVNIGQYKTMVRLSSLKERFPKPPQEDP